MQIAQKAAQLEIIAYLLQAGADPNICDQNNWSVAHMIVRQNDIVGDGNLLEWVLANQISFRSPVDFNISGGTKNWTPLHVAAY
jgi:ankyrin repeat protein